MYVREAHETTNAYSSFATDNADFGNGEGPHKVCGCVSQSIKRRLAENIAPHILELDSAEPNNSSISG